MSDAPQDTAPDTTNVVPGAPPMQFLGQYIKDLSFETPLAPDIFNVLRQTSPEMDVTIDANVRQLDGPVFEVTVSINMDAKAGDKTAFIMELIYGCVVELNTQLVPQEQAHALLLIEVPRHLFPFLRQIVASTTAAGGFPPVMVQMIDFTDLYRRKFASGDQPPQGPVH